jgi:phospholipid/cholesterol/gamma-HCH transport system permease protein
MSVNPMGFVVAPKALAMAISMPLLSALFIVCGLAGGYVVGAELLGVDPGRYVSGLESAISFREDVLGSLLKSLVFGVVVGLIATYQGYTARPNAAGVSAATTSTVVRGSVATLLLDYIITALWGIA